jgi:hypothetical protein
MAAVQANIVDAIKTLVTLGADISDVVENNNHEGTTNKGTGFTLIFHAASMGHDDTS